MKWTKKRMREDSTTNIAQWKRCGGQMATPKNCSIIWADLIRIRNQLKIIEGLRTKN